MGKENLKRKVKENQNGQCALTKDELPEETYLYDTDRKKAKAKGGKYTTKNTRVVFPIAHMVRHKTLRTREEKFENLKCLVDDRMQVMKLRNKIANQLRAYERGTDYISNEIVEFLKTQLAEIELEYESRSKAVVLATKDIAKVDELVSAALGVKSVGEMTVAVCLVYIDLEKARYPSSLWAYAGLDKPSHERYTKGETSGGNKKLRTALYMMADSQVKGRGPYRTVYDRKKDRLAISKVITKSRNTQGKLIECMWKNTKPCHRDGAAKRDIMKHFLADYWYVGRTLLGLPIPPEPSYAEAVLGDGHKTIMPQERGWKWGVKKSKGKPINGSIRKKLG